METSTQAYIKFKEDCKKEKHNKAILDALLHLGVACSKEIAFHTELSYVQVSRRLKELEIDNKIYVIAKEKTKFYDTKVNIYALKNE